MKGKESVNEAESLEQGMPILEHIGELRKRIIYCLIVFVVGLVGGLFGAQPLFDYLVGAAPVDSLSLHAFSPWDAIGLFMKFAFLISLLLLLPFAMYQLWAFVRPGLRREEQSATLRYVPGALIMFLIGLAFSYYVVFPMAFYFTQRVTVNMGLTEMFGVTQYFSFLFNILLPISLLFELPVVILFLTRIGLLHPRLLQKMRRVAWFALIVVGVIVTPPDFISDFLVAVPLIALYEFSVMLSLMAYRKRMAARSLSESD